MKRLLVAITTIVALSFFQDATLAHPGRLDKKGGHYDQKTGFYHLHRDGDSTTEYNVEFDQQIQGAKVVKVIDGDTIEIEHGMLKERVRYIGIDTPERGKPYYQEAKEYNTRLVLDKKVTLKLDVHVRDKYGRLLAYVYLEDGQDTFVNAKLVQNGYAVIMTVPPNVKHAELFLKLQREAVRYQRGLWGLRNPVKLDTKLPQPTSKDFHERNV